MLEQLLQLVPPPVQPVDADRSMLAALENHLATPLPHDWIEISTTYGNGCLGDSTYEFTIQNVLAADAIARMSHEISLFRSLRDEQPERYDLPMFPDNRGFLSIGTDVDGGTLGFVTDGPPESWSIATRWEDGEGFDRWQISLSEFLVRSLTRQIRSEIFRPDFPEDTSRLTFHRRGAYR